MKFEEMKYERPDIETFKAQVAELVKKLNSAASFEEADAQFLAFEKLEKHIETLYTLAQIRHDINTNDTYYADEMKFWNTNLPIVEGAGQEFTNAMLDGIYRAQFEEKYGKLMFADAELDRKAFSEKIIPMMQEEAKLANEYEDLLAGAKIPFEGKTLTLSQMEPYQNDPDDERRLAAWIAVGFWYKSVQPQMDEIYDRLVKLRTGMGQALGCKDYTQLGYWRMHRNCWTRSDIEKFREAVVKYVVPVTEEIYQRQAQRLGKEYPMSFADNQLEFRDGNPKPVGTPDDIVQHGLKFYEELSPETGKFFRMMIDNHLMDLLSRDGKRGGGYCTTIPDAKVPYIFANFNSTQGDVEVITHEAGHAFEAYLNIDRVPSSYVWPSSEACECHSMSMEFFGQEWADDFFGPDAQKYRYSHLAGALKFIPYGTLVDHFQHEVYDHPEYTPAQRHAVWKRLMGVYMPWEKLDGKIPFFAEGEHWELKHHIYSDPYYYVDYCLAQTVSLVFWAMIQDDMPKAWDTYMKFTRMGGSRTFTELLKEAGLPSPFEEETLKGVCAKAEAWLKKNEI